MDMKTILIDKIDKYLIILSEKHNKEMKNLEKLYNDLILMKVLLLVDKNCKAKILDVDFKNNIITRPGAVSLIDDNKLIEKIHSLFDLIDSSIENELTKNNMIII